MTEEVAVRAFSCSIVGDGEGHVAAVVRDARKASQSCRRAMWWYQSHQDEVPGRRSYWNWRVGRPTAKCRPKNVEVAVVDVAVT